MCGIFGYIGKKNAAESVMDGLKRLEYRGYDSWGIAVVSKPEIAVFKKVGAIGTIDGVDLPNSTVAIGHTRWATHGGVSDVNAHPHYSSDKSFVLAQNGMVENFEELKKKLLKKGYKFESETDTEVIVRLIEEELKSTESTKGTEGAKGAKGTEGGSLKEAVRTVFGKLKGRNTIILLAKNGQILACRNGSPLVVGKEKSGEVYFSSDTLSFANAADYVFVVDNGEMVVADSGRVEAFDLKSGKKVPLDFKEIGFIGEVASKEGFDHFMMKEIFDTPEVIKALFLHGEKEYADFAKEIKRAANVYTIGSGTAGVAAAQIAYFLRSIAKINAVSLVGADSYEYLKLINKNGLIIAPSQSGETADVLEVLENLAKKGVKIASFVNMPGSMITKISNFPFMAGAGAEICVMSTKVFTSQIAWGYLVAKAAAGEFSDGRKRLLGLALGIQKYLQDKNVHKDIKDLAKKLEKAKDIFLLAKAQNYQIIREGMVKLIESTYKHAHAMPAGDLKHYAITLMEKGVPVLVVISNDEVKNDVISAISQVRARGASVIGIAPFANKDFEEQIVVPDLGEVSCIFNVVVLQLLAYYMAVKLGNNVDRPRNIAKSVTVK